VDQQEDGHYPGHMFIIMVIHYLQQRHPQVLPVLHEVSHLVALCLVLQITKLAYYSTWRHVVTQHIHVHKASHCSLE